MNAFALVFSWPAVFLFTGGPLASLHLEGQVSLLLSPQLTSEAATLLWGPSRTALSQLVLFILDLVSHLGVKKSGPFFFSCVFHLQ